MNVNHLVTIIFITVTYLVIPSTSWGIYKDLSRQNDVLIINYNNGCRFCKTMIDYINQVYAFLECSMNYDIRQRFKFSRGKSSKIFSYNITNQADKTNRVKTYPGLVDEFFITQNKNGSNLIISASENNCLTNPISINTLPYHISPSLNNINLMFAPCAFNTQNVEQEFYIESSIEPWFFKGKINLYYINTATLLSSGDINEINSNYSDFRMIMYISNTNSHLSFIPNSSTFDIELPVNENSYILGNNHETIPFNPNYFCIYATIPKNIQTSLFLTPFVSRDRCQLNSIFTFEYFVEKLNKVDFKFINVTLGNYLNSSYLTANSNITFTNSTDGKVYKYNLAQSSFSNFTANLSFGNYSTSLSIKPNPDFESVFEGLNFSINDCSFVSLNIPFREKINNVKFTIKNEANGGILSTSYFPLNTNIVFTRSSNGQLYTYNVGSGNLASFEILLHFDTYSISSTEHNQWSRLTNSVVISNYSSTAFDIIMREKTSQATFYFKFSNLGNESTNTCVFQNGTILSLRLTDNRTVTHTISGCNNTVVWNLFFGTWVIENFTIASSNIYTTTMNANQSFQVNNSNNSSFDIFLTRTKNTSLATFSFKFSNLSNQAGDTCIFVINSSLVFKFTDNSTVNTTITGCNTTLSANLYIGQYIIDSFSIASNANYTITMNPSQSFNVVNSSNSYFDIFLTKQNNAPPPPPPPPPAPGTHTFQGGSLTYVHPTSQHSILSLTNMLSSTFSISIKIVLINYDHCCIGVSNVEVNLPSSGSYLGLRGVTGELSFCDIGYIGKFGTGIYAANRLPYVNNDIVNISGVNGLITFKVNGNTNPEHVIDIGTSNLYLSFTLYQAGNSLEIVN